jgi:outer membrane receptor protein involved in Fe transport
MCSAVCAAGILIAEGAAAQVQLDEIVVVAQKREQRLQDVPVALSAFTRERLLESGVRDFFEVANIDPALFVTTQQSSTTASFGIRGVSTSSQNFGLESSVGLYVDGVYRSRQSAMINNLVDVNSIEVLRGPQGTLFGRNTSAGAINVITRAPDFSGEGYLEVGAGDLDMQTIDGAKSITLVEDVLAIRATGFYLERDGYVDAINIEDDVIQDRDRFGGRLSALYLPSDTVTIQINADYSEIDETCCAIGNWYNNLQAQQLPPGSPPVFGTDNDVIDAGGTVIDQDDFFEREVAVSFLPQSQNEDKGVSLQFEWALPSFGLTSITASREFDSLDDVDGDFYDIDAVAQTRDSEQSQFSQELRIRSQGERLTYVAGLFYFEQDLDATVITRVGEDTAAFVGLPGLENLFPAGGFAQDVSEQEHQAYAVFGQIDLSLTDSVQLTAGLRWTKEDKDMVNTFTEVNAGPGFALFAPLAPRPDVDENIDDDQVTGTVKLTWFAAEDIMFYASYGTGYKAGGINADRIAQTLDVVFDAEETEAYEVGMKAQFPEQALRVNIALHSTVTDDLQTVAFEGTGFALQNAGKAETWGGELDLLWQPFDYTTLTVAYAYNDGEYDDFENGPCWIATPFHTGQPDPEQNADGSCDRSGGLLAGNPENTAAVSLRQDIPLGDSVNAFIYGEYIWVDERMTDVNNDPLKLAEDYDIINVRAGLVFENWDVELTAWGRNLGDEEYPGVITDATGNPGRLTTGHNEPTTWGVTLRKNFR